jgi:hypothetical protein
MLRARTDWPTLKRGAEPAIGGNARGRAIASTLAAVMRGVALGPRSSGRLSRQGYNLERR